MRGPAIVLFILLACAPHVFAQCPFVDVTIVAPEKVEAGKGFFVDTEFLTYSETGADVKGYVEFYSKEESAGYAFIRFIVPNERDTMSWPFSAEYTGRHTVHVKLFGNGCEERDFSAHVEVVETRGEVLLIANEIDLALAAGLVEFLRARGVGLRVGGAAAQENLTAEAAVVLGGPDAPDGVGEVVRGILTEDDQERLREEGSKAMFLVEGVWAEGQKVFVIAGPDRERTREAHEENREALLAGL